MTGFVLFCLGILILAAAACACVLTLCLPVVLYMISRLFYPGLCVWKDGQMVALYIAEEWGTDAAKKEVPVQ